MYRERVSILYDNSHDPRIYQEGKAPRLLPSQEDTRSEAKHVEEALSQLGFKTRRIEIVYERIEVLMEELLRYRGEVVFNLCEDIRGEGIYESYVVSLLEILGIEYTGSKPMPLALCLDKAKAKTFLAAHGLPTPRHVVLERRGEPLPRSLRYPLIVKLLHEDGSLGIDKDSVVYGKRALWERVEKLVKEYEQPVMAEEYIHGREFNISLLGNGKSVQILPIAEIDYSPLGKDMPKILTYASKWDESSSEYQKTIPVCPAPLSASLERKLATLALSACRILGCRDYARVDVRVKGKTPYIIEVNPNPCISSDAGFVRSARVAGFSYAELVGKIVAFAIARKRAKAMPTARQWSKERQMAS